MKINVKLNIIDEVDFYFIAPDERPKEFWHQKTASYYKHSLLRAIYNQQNPILLDNMLLANGGYSFCHPLSQYPAWIIWPVTFPACKTGQQAGIRTLATLVIVSNTYPQRNIYCTILLFTVLLFISTSLNHIFKTNIANKLVHRK